MFPLPRCLAALVLPALLYSQTSPITLEEAVKRSLEKYPTIRMNAEQVSAASAGIQLARTSYLPKADLLAQINRATRNNIYGMLLPQSTIAPISGPPNPTNAGTNVWGTATGILISWEPFDFGLRKAGIESAEASRRRAEMALERTRFEVAVTTADAFLTILAAQQTAASAQAGVERAKVFHDVVSAMVKAELRPGVEASRARAELAMAETQQIQAEQATAVARAALAQMLGVTPPEIALSPGRLLESPAEPSTASTDAHPALKEQQAAIEESKARLLTIDRSYYPKFNVQAATYARGTGANPDFTTGGGASGLGPNIYNWGVGFTVTFPFFDYASSRAKKQAESSRVRAEEHRLELIRQELNGQLERAKAMLEGSRRVAANIPFQLDAARAAETQATARYKAGLGNLVEVAEAQRLLTQTEIDDSLARLQIWRALFAVAVAQGEMDSLAAGASRR
ncbi:MAG: TolC family protein [Acidimicrobiia bacterium]|nr:TolC family protein [Acidimicrobiia bacterium]